MQINFKAVLFFSLAVIFSSDAVPQHGDQLNTKQIAADTSANTYYQSIFDDSDAAISGQSQIPSQILTKCLCVPYYRCDPGHWEKTEHDHCTRFTYVCCYGSEAVEYAMNHE